VTYFALGHCHDPYSRAGRVDDGMPAVVRGAWVAEGFITLLRNAIAFQPGG
jgi:hypothetical protein